MHSPPTRQANGYFPARNCSSGNFRAPQPPSPVDTATGKTLYTLHYERRRAHKQRLEKALHGNKA